MIYTVTLNPALDYILDMSDFKTGKINYNNKNLILPGGKGINVSIVLKELNIPSITLGFVSGFVGEEIDKKVKKNGIKTDFIKINENDNNNNNSRINIKITTPKKETAINCEGPFIEEKYIKQLYEKIDKLQNCDTLILSGSIPKGIKKNIYQDICKRISKKEIRVVIDTTGELLMQTLKYHPFLIKPNRHELGEIFGVEISNKEDALMYAKKLQEQGAKNVLISMGKMGAVLVDENGYSYKMKALDNQKRINTVGAGDSMVAGFIAGYELFKSYEKAFVMGSSAGAATANSILLANKEEIYSLFEKYS